MAQPENDGDERTVIYSNDRRFVCNAWHVLSQALEFDRHDSHQRRGVRASCPRGPGLLAHLLRAGLPEQESVVAQLQPSLVERAS